MNPKARGELLISYAQGPALLKATLARFQYFRRTNPERFSPLLRKFISRLHLSQHDVQVLRGMLAQFNYFTFGDHGPQRLGEPAAPATSLDDPAAAQDPPPSPARVGPQDPKAVPAP